MIIELKISDICVHAKDISIVVVLVASQVVVLCRWPCSACARGWSLCVYCNLLFLFIFLKAAINPESPGGLISTDKTWLEVLSALIATRGLITQLGWSTSRSSAPTLYYTIPYHTQIISCLLSGGSGFIRICKSVRIENCNTFLFSLLPPPHPPFLAVLFVSKSPDSQPRAVN